jgi:predicted amidohydrolase
MRVLLGQLEVTPGEPARNAERLVGALAAHPDADLAVFPELYLGGYDIDRVQERAIAADDPMLDANCDAARANTTAVVVGFAECVGTGVAHAVGCIAEDGGWAGTYARRTSSARASATPSPRARSSRWSSWPRPAWRRWCASTSSSPSPPAPSPAPARNCWSPWRRTWRLSGATTSSRPPRARFDNRLPHVYVNRVGEEGGLQFVGAGCAMSADGLPGAVLGDGPDVAVVELAVGSPPAADVDYLRHARPDLPVHLPRSRPQ